jgi:hypothetical protein
MFLTNHPLLKYHLMPMFLKYPQNLLNHLYLKYHLHLPYPMFLLNLKLQKTRLSLMFPKSHPLLMYLLFLHYLK